MKDFPELYEILANHQATTDGGAYPDELIIRRSLQLREQSPKFFVGDLASDRYFVSDQLRDLIGLESNSVSGLDKIICERICHDLDREIFLADAREIHALTQAPTSLSRDVYYRIRNSAGEVAWIYQNIIFVPNFSDFKKSLLVGTFTKLNAMYLFNQTRGHLQEEGLSRDIIELLREHMGSSVVGFQLPMFTVKGNPVGERLQDILLMRMGLLLNNYCPDSIQCYRLKNQLFAGFVAAQKVDPEAIADEINGILKRVCADLGIDPIAPCHPEHVFNAHGSSQVELLSAIIGFINAQPKLNETYVADGSTTADSVTMSEALDLVKSLSDNFSGFTYVIQPVVDARTHQIQVGEVLLRSRDSRRGIAPGRFVSLIEDGRMIVPFGRHTLDRAIELASQTQKIDPEFLVSINFSPMQMIDPHFLDYMKLALQKYGADPKRIVLELTEMAGDRQGLNTDAFFDACRALGMQLAIDDFGEGANMLDRLFKTRFDIVKFSRNLSLEGTRNPEHLAFLEAIVNACHAYGARVCMEGIEDEAMIETLSRLKADLYQGYHFSKPIDFEAILEKLHEKRLS